MAKDPEVSVAIRRSLYGDKTILKSISTEDHEYWIVPRKFSIAATDEMKQYQMTQAQGMKGGVGTTISSIAKNHPEITLTEFQDGTFITKIPSDEIIGLIDAAPKNIEARAPLMRIMFLNGIGKHNLNKDGEESDKVYEWLVDEILQNEDLATEIVEVVVGQNPFLLKLGVLAKSQILQNGSSEALPSTQTRMTNSLMEATQEKSLQDGDRGL